MSWHAADYPSPYGGDIHQSSRDDAFEPDIVYRSIDASIQDDEDELHQLGHETVWKSVALDDEPELQPFEPQGYGSGLKNLSLGQQPPTSSYNDTWLGLARPDLQPKSLSDAVVVVGKTTTSSSSRRSADAPPMAPGGWLEPNYHFMSRAPPGEVFSALQRLLIDRGIDFTVKPNKFKLKCVTYPGGCRLPYYIRLFSTDTPQQCAVEFQRRSGCILAFSNLFKDARKVLQEQGLIEDKTSSFSPVLSPEEVSLACSELSLPELEFEVTEEESRETMQCLMDMAASECGDVKVQALQALSQLTLDKGTQELMVEEGCLDLFVKCMGRESTECELRCAITGLGNLAKDCVNACEKLKACKGVSAILATAGCDMSTPQIVRECARALANCALQLKTGLVVNLKCEVVRRHLKVLETCNDAQTQRHFHAMMDQLKLNNVDQLGRAVY